MRRLRVLSEHPHLGKPSDVVPGFEGAQAYVDAGLAEWVVEDREVDMETTALAGAPEATVIRRGPGRPRKTAAE